MNRAIGVFLEEQIVVGLVDNLQVIGSIRMFPESKADIGILDGMPTEEIARKIVELVKEVADGNPIEAVGLGCSGLIRRGVIEESPQLPQMKGSRIQESLEKGLGDKGEPVTVSVLNSADAVATGIAALKGDLDQVVRVWRLGMGVAFGHHPLGDSVWEGGHTVVSLDPRETFCRCGGVGHMEGIMGYRAMRLRFLDLEPEEVFEQARAGDQRCRDFVDLWHRALAAGTASSIHMDRPGRFYITGPHAKYVRIDLVKRHLNEMVQLSSLQNNTIEIHSSTDETALIGAAVYALESRSEAG